MARKALGTKKPTDNDNPKPRKRDERTRNWVLIVYPDSAPENWRTILDDLHIQWIESPLHDKDVNPDADDHEKKAHWHVLLLFDGNKSFEQVCEIADQLHCAQPQVCQSPSGMVRYMIHMDNPEKYQYSREDIVAHGGADVLYYLRPTSVSRYSLLAEMTGYIRDNQITEYSDFIDYALREHFDDWFPLLADNSSIFINSYISSMRNKLKTAGSLKPEAEVSLEVRYHVNAETGEVAEIKPRSE